jgi:hypothetical protein
MEQKPISCSSAVTALAILSLAGLPSVAASFDSRHTGDHAGNPSDLHFRGVGCRGRGGRAAGHAGLFKKRAALVVSQNCLQGDPGRGPQVHAHSAIGLQGTGLGRCSFR